MVIYLKSLIILWMALFLIADANAQKRIKIPKEKSMAAYLMVYFKDDTHGLYFAVSKDGYSFTDVNNGRPIISGDTIADQKGIRDPYIFRNPSDGYFYMALTDLHIYAQKAGYRNTLWERDATQYGWGNNRNIVILKSADLVHWTHHLLRVNEAFPELNDIGCAWAPEMIYNNLIKKTMLYFTMRFKNGRNQVYFSYMNNDFTRLETFPKVIFEYPKSISDFIDADITKVGNKYHMFYCSHDGTAGIKQAVSDSLDRGYKFDPTWYDPEPRACEAPTIFKRIGQQKWVLVYDIYGIKPQNFGFSETTDFIHFTDLGHFNEGIMKSTNFTIPKHPAIIQITNNEANQILSHWSNANHAVIPQN